MGLCATEVAPYDCRAACDNICSVTTEAKGKAGLEDVVATSSGICFIDGDRGILAYRGYDIHDLAPKASFEEVCYLLWHGQLPNRAELGELQSQFAASRALPEGVVRLMRRLPPSEAMDTLRTLASALSHYDKDAIDHSPAANYRKAVRLTAQMASLVAAIGRVEQNQSPIDPDPELNASTFAARVAAATLTDIHSAIVAGICALKGPLHGGANAEVMKMLLDFGASATPEKVEATIREKLARKEKIPGFGHRVYHTMDPRAVHLRQLSKDLGKRSGQPHWVEMSERIEGLVKSEKKLNPNVDFYSASMYYALGIPVALYTPIFAVSRTSGWTAHVLEQYANNRLIRPRAEYTGPSVPQQWVALDAR